MAVEDGLRSLAESAGRALGSVFKPNENIEGSGLLSAVYMLWVSSDGLCCWDVGSNVLNNCNNVQNRAFCFLEGTN